MRRIVSLAMIASMLPLPAHAEPASSAAADSMAAWEARERNALPTTAAVHQMKRNIGPGVAFTLVGAALLVTGLAYKFGPEEAKFTSEGIKVEKTYSAANYGLMIGGGVAMLIGVVSISTAPYLPGTAVGGSISPGLQLAASFAF